MNTEQPRWTRPRLKLQMLTGKARGLQFELPDIPGVIEHHGERLLVTLSGMEGEAVLLPENPSCN